MRKKAIAITMILAMSISIIGNQAVIAAPTIDETKAEQPVDTTEIDETQEENNEPYGGDESVLGLDESTSGNGYEASQEQVDKVNELIEQKQLESESNNKVYKPQISFGADLGEEARKIVMGLMGIPEENIENYEVTEVYHEEELNRLSKYIPADKLGNGAISCVAITPLPEGSGISVSTTNIDYVTNLMYYNVLVTAGVKDIDVQVAAPTNSSGSCALVGMLNAYQNMTQEKISDSVIDVAMNEMSVVDTLSNHYGADTASKLLDSLKGKIIENGSTDVQAIKGIVRGIAGIQKMDLTDEEIQMTAECMAKITALSNERKLAKIESSVKYIGSKDFKKEIDEFGSLLGSELANFILCR